ncbi:MAG: ribonuclease VapC [Candidatus Verstraetearchaeota archaeon]|nr:ribonuclease VapC [Candidatus Verstraetearchaeota archaeon]
MSNIEVVILDSSAIINGYDPSSASTKNHFISGGVVDEIKDSKSRMMFERALDVGKLRIINPSIKYLKYVDDAASKTGDANYLSKADMEVLALALEMKDRGLKPIIVSDDFTIQNLAAHLGIRYISVSTIGIRRVIEWIVYCPACGRRYNNERLDRCLICGTELKRKPKPSQIVQ